MQDNNNIGNRLQNFALQYVLSKYTDNIVNLDNGYGDIPSPTLKSITKQTIKILLAKIGIKKFQFKLQKQRNWQIRHKANEKFSSDYIKSITTVNYSNVYQKGWKNIDVAVVGSDQVWHNWHRNKNELEFYYLEFLPKKKRVSYAASFGFEDFPEEDLKKHIKGIKGMNYISCREKSGCKLVKEVIDQEVPHVLDPTLLLTSNEWQKLLVGANKYSKTQRNYAFLYFLGDIPTEYKKEISNKIKKKKLKVINFLDFTNNSISSCGPLEFVSLIENADYVFTDSFHCTVFSILFNKQFEVFRRKEEGMEKMFGRIEELLVNTGNQNKAFNGINSNLEAENMNTLRKASIDYIKKVLNYEVQ